jgi:hypothetical protein
MVGEDAGVGVDVIVGLSVGDATNVGVGNAVAVAAALGKGVRVGSELAMAVGGGIVCELHAVADSRITTTKQVSREFNDNYCTSVGLRSGHS